jgi:WD40 repeat protein
MCARIMPTTRLSHARQHAGDDERRPHCQHLEHERLLVAENAHRASALGVGLRVLARFRFPRNGYTCMRVLALTRGHFALCVFAASSDNSLRLWDLELGESIRQYSGHTKAIVCVALSEDAAGGGRT